MEKARKELNMILKTICINLLFSLVFVKLCEVNDMTIEIPEGELQRRKKEV